MLSKRLLKLLRKAQLVLNRNRLKNIASQVGNSFFVFEKEELVNVYGKLKTSLGENGAIAFSIKSNYFGN